ncbi:MAG: retention module-containing protein [Rhodocyclaceae bacterium]|jgi:T1SS-143 domain-containing protein|nr:retention module-containing protein [Rhodocyclaceae bacterium]
MSAAATVVSVQGEAFARSPNGTMRRLSNGDTIQQGEVVITSLGGQIELLTADGQMMTVNAQESFKFGSETSQASAPEAGEAAVQQVVQQPGELNVEQLLEQEAAAAGLGGGGENGGNSFVRLMRIVEPLNPLSYEFPNPFAGNEFPSLGDEITDDAPVGANDIAGLDEDGAGGFIINEGNAGGTGDTEDPASFSGRMGYSFGLNGPAATGAFVWTGANSDVAITSGGVPVEVELSANGLTLTGYIQGEEGRETVFVLEVTNYQTGDYTMTLYRQLDHYGADEDNIDITFSYRLTDYDGDTATGTLSATINDDTPVLLGGDEGEYGNVVTGTIHSSGEWGGEDQYDGESGYGGAPTSTVDSWSFTVNESGPVTIDIRALEDQSDLNGDGEQTYLDSYIYVFRNDNGQPGELVFSNDDSWSAGEDDGSTHGYDSYGALNLEAGDYILRIGSFSLEEDEARAGLNEGNSGQGDYQVTFGGDVTVTSGPGGGNSGGPGDTLVLEEESAPYLNGNDEEDGLSHTATGTIVDDVAWGADGFGAATAVTVGEGEGAVSFEIPLEGSVSIFFDADGNLIQDQPEARTYDSGEWSSPALEMVFNSDGTYTVTVIGAMNHGGEDEDILQLPAIAVTGVDGDGDPVDVPLNISVQDDVPVLSGEDISQTIDEANIGTAYSTGTEAGDGPAVVNGDLSQLVSFGADGEGSFGFSANFQQVLASTDFWWGIPVPVQLTYSIVTNGDIATLVATEPDMRGDFRNSSNTVFELELNTANGEYEFRLSDELRHTGESDETIALNFGAIIEARDGDNDPVTLGQAFSINVQDDVPSPQINLTGTNVQHDETPGNQPQPDDDTSSNSVALRFSGIFGIGGVSNPGNDPDVAGSGAIGYARSGTAVVSIAGSEAGADHLASDSLSLRVVDSASGLQTTEGYDITLSVDSLGRIVGRVDDADAGAMNGKAAFAVALDQGGEVFVAQYLSLEHPDTASPDDVIDLAGKIAVRYSMTDTDGDTQTAQVDIGTMVRFADDGPTLTGQTIAQSVNEADIGTDWSTGTAANEGPAVISGGLSGLVNFGADGRGSFEFADNALDQLIALGLASKQGDASRPLSYQVSEIDGVVTITATETDIPFQWWNPASYGDTSNPVFQLSLNQTTGAYEFRLYDELVHANGDAGTVIGINFGSMIKAVDGDGDAISLGDKFTINVQDDVPVLQGESRSIDEDFAGNISGNVLANDEAGADHMASFRWLNTHGAHGDFDGYSNGTYRYDLYNSAAQSLDDGESWTETFRYEVKDSDGDVRTETLTITITGANDVPTISVDTGEWSWSWRHGFRMENDVVDEAALPDGTTPGSNAEFAYGSFKVADPDGLDDIKSVTINNQTILVGDLAGAMINGTSGVLTITSYDSDTGVAQYKYELTQATTDGPGKETDVFTLTTSDGDLDSAPATITIEILDDRPLAASFADTLTVEEESIPGIGGNDESDDGYSHIATGNVVDNVNWGADGFGKVTGVTGGGMAGAWDATAQTYTIETAGYKMVVGQDGSYTFTLKDNTLAAGGGENIAALLNNGFTVSAQDGDGDAVAGGIKIKVNVVDDVPVLVTPSNLVINGSFENPELGTGWSAMSSTEGWNATGNQPIEIGHGGNYGITAKDGDQLLELDSHGNASVAQQVDTEGYGAVTLSFWFASRAHGGDIAATNQVEVFWNGQSLGVITDATAGHWTQHVFNVEANADGATELKFVGVGTQDTFGGLIDNVSVIGMPTVDEDGLDGGGAQLLYASASLPVSFGADGPGDWTGIALNTAVASQGDAVTMEAAARGDGAWYGVADGRDVFKIDIDVDAGTYSFTLIDQLDHAEGSDFMKLDFGFTVTDGDGDPIGGTVSVGVFDDAPTAVADSDDSAPYTGNLLDNDVVGADEAARILNVNGQEPDQDGSIIVQGTYGTLTVNAATGEYSYEQTATAVADITVTDINADSAGYHNTFGYFIKGEDGEPVSGQIIWTNMHDAHPDSFVLQDVDPSSIGWFLIPNGDGISGNTGKSGFVDGADVTFANIGGKWVVQLNGETLSATGGQALFNDNALNAGSNAQNWGYLINNGVPGELNWEDLIGGGDYDNNDVNLGLTVAVEPAGTDEFTYTMSDYDGDTATATLTIDPNIPPYAGWSGAWTNEDTALTITKAQLLALAQDPDGDTLTITNVAFRDVDGNGTADHKGATLVDNDDGTFTFNPAGNFNGYVDLTYTVDDGNGNTATGVYTIDVRPVNDPAILSEGEGSVTEDTNVQTGNVLVTGGTLTITDPDAGQNHFQSSTQTDTIFGGTLVLQSNGAWTYTVNNGNPTLQAMNTDEYEDLEFTVKSADGTPTTISVRVNGLNDNLPPEATDDEVDTVQGQAVTIDALDNDSDPDGDSLSITGVGNGQYGTASVVDGKIVYTPTENPGPDGLVDTLTYTISDGKGGTDTAQIKINIADVGPTANPDVVKAGEVGTATVNLVLVIDSSGSMGTTRMDLAKDAVENLINSYGSALVKVMVVDFDDNAVVLTKDGNVWMSGSDAIGKVNGLQSNDGTDYDDPIYAVINNYGTPPNADNTFVYFLSDGNPNDGNENRITGTDSTGERGDWVEFLTNNGIDDVYAVGIGSNVSPTHLLTVAWSPDGQHSDNVFSVTDEEQLSGTLLNIAQKSTGDVTDNDVPGADGLGTPALVSVKYGATTYTFDADNDSFTIPLGAGKGTLVIEEDGSYTYTPPSGGAYGAPVVVEYTMQDADGSQSSSTLTIDPNDVPSATDDFDTANIAYWQASGNVVASASTQTSAGGFVQAVPVNVSGSVSIANVNDNNSDNDYSENFTIAANTVDATHSAKILFDVALTNWSSGDKWSAQVYKVVSGGGRGNDELISGAVLTNQASGGSGLFISGITSPGTYYVKFTVTADAVREGQTWFNTGRPDLSATNFKYSAWSYTPAQYQNITVTAPDMMWVAALAATGNVMANDDGGIQGAVVAEVNGMPVGTIPGTYGNLVIAADGEYTYTPTTTEVPADAQETFNYTIMQGDGESANATLTIDVGDHIYTPTSGNDLLVGGSGNDIIDGLGGNDRIVGGDGDDVLTGGAGTDYIEGGAGNDTLYGGADSDYLSGGEGNDILVGGAGNDILEGGAGADTFVWTLADVGNGTGTAPHDVVKDFSAAEGDVLDLSSVLTDSTTVIAVDSGGKLGLQVVDASDPAKVYQTITVESVAFGTDEVTTILNNLKDHGTSN